MSKTKAVKHNAPDTVEKLVNDANFIAVIDNQINLETSKFRGRVYFFHNGGKFHLNPNFLVYVKMLLSEDKDIAVIIDSNSIPITVDDLEEFYNDASEQYYDALNSYANEYKKLIESRSVNEISRVFTE